MPKSENLELKYCGVLDNRNYTIHTVPDRKDVTMEL